MIHSHHDQISQQCLLIRDNILAAPHTIRINLHVLISQDNTFNQVQNLMTQVICLLHIIHEKDHHQSIFQRMLEDQAEKNQKVDLQVYQSIQNKSH